MSDHAINISLLVIAILSGLAELGIFEMMLQDRRKDRGMPELPLGRLFAMGVLSLGPLSALAVVYLFATRLSNGHLEWHSWIYILPLLLTCAWVGYEFYQRRRWRKTNAEYDRLAKQLSVPSRLVIHSASYRAIDGGGREYDVAEFLQKITVGDSLVFDIENHNFVFEGRNFVPEDPQTGTRKWLKVEYSYEDGPRITIERKEHCRLALPEDSWMKTEIARLTNDVEILEQTREKFGRWRIIHCGEKHERLDFSVSVQFLDLRDSDLAKTIDALFWNEVPGSPWRRTKPIQQVPWRENPSESARIIIFSDEPRARGIKAAINECEVLDEAVDVFPTQNETDDITFVIFPKKAGAS